MPQKPLPLIISLKHWREQNGFSQSDAVKVLKNSEPLKSFSSADAVNTTTSPQLPKYVSAAFGSLDSNVG
jgi:hypothetical protein